MDIHVTPTPEQKEGIDRLSAAHGKSPQEIVSDAVDSYLQREQKREWLRHEIQHADDQIARGEYKEYRAETLQDFFDGIKRRGRERLHTEHP